MDEEKIDVSPVINMLKYQEIINGFQREIDVSIQNTKFDISEYKKRIDYLSGYKKALKDMKNTLNNLLKEENKDAN